MKKVLFYFAFFALPFLSWSQSSDLHVLASDVLGNNLGGLSISISTTYSPPFSLVVTGPNGFVATATMTSNNYSIANLQPGEYCMAIRNVAECTASLCIKIRKCTNVELNGKTYYSCLEEPAPNPNDPSIVYARGKSSSSSPNMYNYDILTAASLSTNNINSIFNTIGQLTDEIYQYGSTPYDITYQDEVDGNGYDFVFKFVNNSISWVYHNSEIKDSFGRDLNINFSIKDGILYKIQPNPASDRINIIFSSDDYAKCRLNVFDASGSVLIKNIVPSSKEFTVDTKNLPSGLYFLQSTSDQGQFTSKFSILR